MNENEEARCQHCSKPIPNSTPYHFSNVVAHRNGFCAYSCMLKAWGQEKAIKALNTEKEEGRKRL